MWYVFANKLYSVSATVMLRVISFCTVVGVIILEWLKRFFRPLVFIWRGFSLSDGSLTGGRVPKSQFLSLDS